MPIKITLEKTNERVNRHEAEREYAVYLNGKKIPLLRVIIAYSGGESEAFIYHKAAHECGMGDASGQIAYIATGGHLTANTETKAAVIRKVQEILPSIHQIQNYVMTATKESQKVIEQQSNMAGTPWTSKKDYLQWLSNTTHIKPIWHRLFAMYSSRRSKANPIETGECGYCHAKVRVTEFNSSMWDALGEVAIEPLEMSIMPQAVVDKAPLCNRCLNLISFQLQNRIHHGGKLT